MAKYLAVVNLRTNKGQVFAIPERSAQNAEMWRRIAGSSSRGGPMLLKVTPTLPAANTFVAGLTGSKTKDVGGIGIGWHPQ